MIPDSHEVMGSWEHPEALEGHRNPSVAMDGPCWFCLSGIVDEIFGHLL